jgi:hypothetical protein
LIGVEGGTGSGLLGRVKGTWPVGAAGAGPVGSVEGRCFRRGGRLLSAPAALAKRLAKGEGCRLMPVPEAPLVWGATWGGGALEAGEVGGGWFRRGGLDVWCALLGVKRGVGFGVVGLGFGVYGFGFWVQG